MFSTTAHNRRFRFATAVGLAVTSQIAATLNAFAGIVVWDGTCGNTFWSSTCNPGSHTNWMPDVLPSTSDTVSANTLVTLFGGNGDASTVSFPSGLSMTNGSVLNVAGAGGTITNLSITNSSINAQTAGTIVEIDGSSTSNGGAVYGDGKVQNIGTLTGLSLAVKNVAGHPGTFVNTLGGSATFSAIATEPGVSVENDNATLTLVPHAQINGGALGSTGHGLFTNSGTFITQSDGSAISNFTIGCSMLQTDGEFNVQGQSNATGTVLFGGALFSGGEIHVTDNANLRFQVGVSGIYEFDGLTGITGNGNAYVQLGGQPGPDWRVLSNLNANLTATNGFVIESGNVTLTGVLKNQGNAQLTGGTIRRNTSCAQCSPEYLNEGNLTIAPNSGVTIDSWLRNSASATAVHTKGPVSIGANGRIVNEGAYEQRRGSIASVGAISTFDNRGTYVRPNHVDTLDVQNGAPFLLGTGSIARFEKAATTFSGQVNSGLYMYGGDVEVHQDALVRVGGGIAESNESSIYGAGQFRIGGLGGLVHFDVTDGTALQNFLGADASLAGGDLEGGLYLDLSGRIGGSGAIVNMNRFFWNSGTIGYNGQGGVLNAVYTELISGSVDGVDAFFINGEGLGIVEQTGNLSIFNGLVRNFGNWMVIDPVTISGFGSGIFQNDATGGFEFRCDAGVGNVVDVLARFDNDGVVRVASGRANFSNVAQVTGTTLNGGTWIINPGATLDLQGNLTTIAEGAEVLDNGTFVDLDTINSVSGHLSLKGVNWAEPTVNINGGTVDLNSSGGSPNQVNSGTGTLNCILGFVNDYVVPSFARQGAGRETTPFSLVCAAFNNGGTLRPGGPGAPGVFNMDGHFNQSAPGTLQIELGGTTPGSGHDQLTVDGNVALSGTLQVKILPGFQPSAGQRFTIVTATNGTITGTFSQIIGYGQYSLAYSPTSVALTVIVAPKPGDTNGDGVVNVNDLLNVIAHWGTCPAPPAFCAADLNGDGIVNVNDLLDVIFHWG